MDRVHTITLGIILLVTASPQTHNLMGKVVLKTTSQPQVTSHTMSSTPGATMSLQQDLLSQKYIRKAGYAVGAASIIHFSIWQQGLKQGSKAGNPAQAIKMSSAHPKWSKVNSWGIARSIALLVPLRVLAALPYRKKQDTASELQKIVQNHMWKDLVTLLVPQYRLQPEKIL